MRRKTLLRSLLIGFSLSWSVPSFAIYKCEADGKVSYSDEECTGGKTLDISNATPADAAESQQRLDREKRLLSRLENERQKQDARVEKERLRTAKANADQQKKCATLARRQKWADEDAALATGKSGEKARQRARRAAEQYDEACMKADSRGLRLAR